jgi:translation initiation factor 2A
MVTKEVHLYDGHNFAKGIVDKLRLPDIDGVQLAPCPPTYIATYVPEKKVSKLFWPSRSACVFPLS